MKRNDFAELNKCEMSGGGGGGRVLLKFIIYIGGGHCDYSPPGTKKSSYDTVW
jgi:hypothetical protein